MFVVKRTGKKETVNFDKVHKRIAYLVSEPFMLEHVNVGELTIAVIQGLINNIKTADIDTHTATLAASLGTTHRDYLVLASRVSIDNHHKNTLNSFADKISLFYLKKDTNGNPAAIISHNFNKYVHINKAAIDSHIDYNRDYMFDYFGFKTLEKGYLLSIDGEVIERPQDLIMRVAIQIYMPDDIKEYRNKEYLPQIFHSYDMMSKMYYTHATPSLFNSGSIKPNLSSCFLQNSSDSIGGIMKTLTDSVNISKWSGGVGLHVSMWRGKNALIRGTNGLSNGIVPFLRLFNDGARAFNQGGRRNGSFAVYLEPHHPDIMDFLALRLTHGDENERCRDLFTAMWISDLFMERVKANGKWSTFCPDTCPGLNMCYGEEYRALYLKYESEGRQTETMDAMRIWKAIYDSHKASGLPYMLYKDNVNRVNMQNNIGIINSSNLCVSGDTMILTDLGSFDIKSLCETNMPVHNVWSNGKYLPATFSRTGVNKPLLFVTTANGYSIKCTPYHKFVIFTVVNGVETETLVQAKDLQIGSRITNVNSSNDDGNTVIQLTSDTIASVTALRLKEDTYCFNEPLHHKGVFNNMLLGNCTEILIHSSDTETGVCNLSSICLPKFVEDSHSQAELDVAEQTRRALDHEYPVHPKMNWKLLAEVAADITANLNQVIKKTYNPTVEAARSNFRNAPIGIGIQGLADVFLKFGVAFDSEAARDINKKISETIYYGSLSKSSELCRLAYLRIIKNFNEENGYNRTIYTQDVLNMYPVLNNENIYATYKTAADVPKTVGAYCTYLQNGGSHMSNGKFHWEMTGLTSSDLSGLFDWETLRDHIKIYGVCNSLTTAYMPTGTTSQIQGCSPCFEPYVSNIYKRTTLAGSYTVINKYLIKYLHDAGLYNADFNTYMMVNNGSIQNIQGIPDSVKALYKTAWELKQKSIAVLAADRQHFIDQSQSMNVYFEDYTMSKFTAIQFYGWQNKLKTGSYYVRTREAIMPKKFTVSHEVEREIELMETLKKKQAEEKLMPEEEEPVCLMCSS
jgi:ribonucleotide reductase alpha subunit